MTNKRKANKVIFALILCLSLLFLLKIAYDLGYEAANPCIEYSDDCDEIYIYDTSPDNSPIVDCPCIKRKYD